MILPAGSSIFDALFYDIKFVWVVLLLNIDDMVRKVFMNPAQVSAVYVCIYSLIAPHLHHSGAQPELKCC